MQNEECITEKLHQVEIWCMLIFSSIAILFSILVLFVFYKHRETRKAPGDILIILTTTELLISLHYITTAIYSLVNDQLIDEKSTICEFQSYIQITSGSLEYIYNCLFCFYIIFLIRSYLNYQQFNNKRFHVLACVILFFAVGFAFIFNQTGISLFGTCSFRRENNLKFPIIILVAFYFILSCFTFYYLYKKLPESKQFIPLKQQYLKFYVIYVSFTNIILILLSFLNIYVDIVCKDKVMYLYVRYIGNILKSSVPLIFIVIRINDPMIKNQINQLFNQQHDDISEISEIKEALVNRESLRFQTQTEAVISVDFEIINKSEVKKQQKKDSKKRKKIEEIKEEGQEQQNSKQSSKKYRKDKQNKELGKDDNIQRKKQESQLNGNFYESIPQIMRSGQTQTMLMGVLKSFQEIKEIPFEKLQKIDCNSQNILTTYIDQSFINEQQQYMNIQPQICKSLIKLSCPNVFKSMLCKDNQIINLEKSFNLELNWNQIKESTDKKSKGNGGQFLFFTFDNMVILKTITEDEKKSYLQNLHKCLNYFQTTQNSFISKIYGIFEIFNIETSISEYFMIQRNISLSPLKYIQYIYDLKGSSSNRETLKKYPNAVEEKRVLKDLDFERLEQRINIKQASEVAQILENDSKFLKEIGWLDYSLIVFKVNWKKYSQETNINIKDLLSSRINNNLQALKSVKDKGKGIYYSIGIIDYLQEWNFKKYVEKKCKGIYQNEKKISSQDPIIYSERFIKEVIKKKIFEEEI